MATPITALSVHPITDSDGDALAGGKVRFVNPSDTDSQVAVWKDKDKQTAWTQPITLGDDGKIPGTVYTDSDTRMLVSDLNDALVYDIYYPAGTAAGNVEVKNAGFNGATGGTTTAGARTNLDAVLTSIYASVGGTDAKFMDSAGGTERAVRVVINEQGLSVKSRGAKGDGATDDTAAFNSAIAILKAAGGGTLLVPDGTYLVNDALTVDFGGLLIRALGDASIQSTVNNKDLFTVTLTGSNQSFMAENLHVGVATSVGGNSSGYGFKLNTVQAGYLLNCRTSVGGTNFFARGVDLTSCTNFNIMGGYYNAADWVVRANSGDRCSVIGAVSTTAGVYSAANTFRMIGIYVTKSGGTVVELGGTATYNSLTGSILAAGDLVIGATVAGFSESNNTIVGTVTDNSAGSSRHRWFSLKADVAADTASANDLTLLSGHRVYPITGTTQINTIAAGHMHERLIVLKFAAGVTVAHNTAGTGARLFLSGAANFGATADDTLTLAYDGTYWREVARTVI